MSARLPAALQDAIERFVDDIAPKELAARSGALSETYRSGRTSESAIRDDRDVAAYLTTRLPATYAATEAALSTVKERAPRFAPARLLDAGAGPGTASWAAAEVWPLLQSITMLDRHARLLTAARTLAQTSGHPALATAHFISGDLAAATLDPTSPYAGRPMPPKRPSREGGSGGGPSTKELSSTEPATHDLVLAGYALAELPAQRLDDAALALWNACSGVLVIVEPGTPAGFNRILACRSSLLAAGARVVAPCPAPYPCPILSPDWCHFARRLPRSRAHLRAKSAQVPFEDEKFSYLAVAREGVELALVSARIVAPPRAEKPGIRFRLCTNAQIVERIVFKRDKPAFKAVSRKSWGDSL